MEGPYAESRNEWRKAQADAAALLMKLKAAIAKTRDTRSTAAAAGIDRLTRRIPDLGAVLDALADAEEQGGETAALREQARKTAQLASYHLRSDRLLAMLRDNPFLPVSVDKIFVGVLQKIQRELK